MYERGTRSIRIAGTEVHPLPLFTVLDGKTTRDYAQRVEPSPQGGRKLGQAIVKAVLEQTQTALTMEASASRLRAAKMQEATQLQNMILGMPQDDPERAAFEKQLSALYQGIRTVRAPAPAPAPTPAPAPAPAPASAEVDLMRFDEPADCRWRNRSL